MESGDDNEPVKPDSKNSFNHHKLEDYDEFTDQDDIEYKLENSSYPVEEDMDALDWEITSVNIYTVNGIPLFSANYNSDLDKFDSSVVMQFHGTVKKFAEENLGSKLVDFKVGKERVFFRVDNSQGYIYLITSKLGKKAKSGINSEVYLYISSLITDLSALISFYDDEGKIAEDFNMDTAISETVEEINGQALSESEDTIFNDLAISYTLITDNTGIPILSRTYVDDTIFNEDPMLVTMFLHALNVFFNTNFSDELNEINFGNYRLYIKNINQFFYAVVFEFGDQVDIREESEIHKLAFNVIDHMISIIAELGEEFLKVTSEDDLKLMVDSTIFKGMLKLKEKLQK